MLGWSRDLLSTVLLLWSARRSKSIRRVRESWGTSGALIGRNRCGWLVFQPWLRRLRPQPPESVLAALPSLPSPWSPTGGPARAGAPTLPPPTGRLRHAQRPGGADLRRQ